MHSYVNKEHNKSSNQKRETESNVVSHTKRNSRIGLSQLGGFEVERQRKGMVGSVDPCVVVATEMPAKHVQ